MRFKILWLSLILLMISISQAGLGSFFKKVLNPVYKVSEQILGEVVNATVKLQYRSFDKDPEATAWVRHIFDRIVAVNDRHDVKYRIGILDTGSVNAFALPGGYVYVTKGLLQRVQSDDELAGVLGHEVGHIAAKHSMNTLKHQIVYQIILNKMKDRSDRIAKLGAIYSLFAGLRYSRKNEQESDYLGARYAAAAGYNPGGMTRFLKILQSLHPGDPSKLQISLSSHPPSNRRVKKMLDYEATLPKELLERPYKLSYNFAAKHPLKAREKEKLAKKPGAKVESQPSTVVQTSTPVTELKAGKVIYTQSFEEQGKPGIAKGMKVSQSKGIFLLDHKTFSAGKSSQRFNIYKKTGCYALSTEGIAVLGGVRYRVRTKIKTSNVEINPHPTGAGALLGIQEFSDRSFVRAHPAVFQAKGSSPDFKEYVFEFQTDIRTRSLFLEIGMCRASGQAWFDDLILESL